MGQIHLQMFIFQLSCASLGDVNCPQLTAKSATLKISELEDEKPSWDAWPIL